MVGSVPHPERHLTEERGDDANVIPALLTTEVMCVSMNANGYGVPNSDDPVVPTVDGYLRARDFTE